MKEGREGARSRSSAASTVGMGVRGLTSWVAKNCDAVLNLQRLQPGTVLLIDGNGLGFFLLEHLGAWAWLGDYEALDAAARRYIRNLRRAGLVPRVYVDGRQTRCKAATHAKRRESLIPRLNAGAWIRMQPRLHARGGTCHASEPPIHARRRAFS